MTPRQMPLLAEDFTEAEQTPLLTSPTAEYASWFRALLACCQCSERWLLALAPFCAVLMLVSGVTVLMILFPTKSV